MTRFPLERDNGGGRFPGFSSIDQLPHWDSVTAELVARRLDTPGEPRFFNAAQYETVRQLADRLLYQQGEPRVPVEAMIDQRLADKATDGWHYADMPYDPDAWLQSIEGLDEDAMGVAGVPFAEAGEPEQLGILDAVHTAGNDDWHGMRAQHVWNIWIRYVTHAFYSHPTAWDEIGFAGPAYPRGYKNIGVDRLEPFEVPDHHDLDPVGKLGQP